ncbi:hypothetical protein ACHHV8_32105 [Paenibacillus sp. TAB 01]|uniref:hypothetical protein n=1 Tax=Paenibacillus sp. TAB 01 TaxID=3368988 RepID=UPI0037514CF7
MPTVYLFISIAICMLCLSSLMLLYRRMHPLILVHGYFVGTILMQQSFAVLSLNLHYVKPVLGLQAFWAFKLPGLFVQPILLLWGLKPLFSRKHGAGAKLCLILIPLLLMTAVDAGMKFTGFIAVMHWNAFFSALRYALILLAAWAYLKLLQRLMRAEEVSGL